MIKPNHPQDEAERLRALQALDLLDTPAEERFDRYTRLASRSFDVPIALVSLVDGGRQWFKSRVGLEASETPRDVSFCGHAILQQDLLVVPDAFEDRRFADNPLVTGEPHVRFYAGCPLRAPEGSRIGTLCLIGHEARSFSEEDRRLLQDLALLVEEDLHHRALANIDELTGLSNRRGFEALAGHALGLCKRLERKASLLFLDLDGFKAVNDDFGHAEGDRALRETAAILMDCFRDSDVIARIGGDEFAVLLPAVTDSKAPVARLQARLDQRNALPGQRYELAGSVGVVAFDPRRHGGLAPLMADADRHMYESKRERREGRDA